MGGRKGIRPVKTEWCGAGVVICLERGTDLHMAQVIPVPLTVSCSGEIQIGYTFLVPAHLGTPGQRAAKRVCVTLPRRRTGCGMCRFCSVSVAGSFQDFHVDIGGSTAWHSVLRGHKVTDMFRCFDVCFLRSFVSLIYCKRTHDKHVCTVVGTV